MIIGISGKKQVGKNTFANYLEEHLNTDKINFLSFAAKLKGISCLLLNEEWVDTEEYKNSKTSIFDCTRRELLQQIGTKMREIDEDFWVKTVNLKDGYYNIITDVRYKNEARWIKENGGIIIRLFRDTGLNDTHSSEIDLDDYNEFDYIVDSNCTLEELNKQALAIAKKLKQ